MSILARMSYPQMAATVGIIVLIIGLAIAAVFVTRWAMDRHDGYAPHKGTDQDAAPFNRNQIPLDRLRAILHTETMEAPALFVVPQEWLIRYQHRRVGRHDGRQPLVYA